MAFDNFENLVSSQKNINIFNNHIREDKIEEILLEPIPE